jgi:ribonuclease G
LRRELLIAAAPGEWRAVLLEAGVAVELYVERGDGDEVDSIHLGRVRRLVPGLGAVLVDIGGQWPAFLPRNDTLPRSRPLHEGERVIVQIRREAQGGKAARVTERLRFPPAIAPHRTPGTPALAGGCPGALSARAEREGPAKREGDGPSENENLAAEEAERRRREILDRAARLDPPARLDPAASFAAALRCALLAVPGQIFVDDPAAIPEIRIAFPDIAVEQLPEAEWPIDLDEAFAEAMSQTVALSGAGSVHFEATRAGVLIDVDSGTAETGSLERTGIETNLAAAATIAWQIRLRNLGGGIIVDFVGLDRRALRDKVRTALAEALASDPAGPKVLGWTRLGHLELVRPRRGRPFAEALLEPRPGGACVKTAITMAYEVLRALRREARAQPGRRWRLIVAPSVAASLTSEAVLALQETERRFARKIVIEADSGLDGERFQIAPL